MILPMEHSAEAMWGTNVSGQNVYPMYKVDIITQKQVVAKTYEV